MKKLVISAAVFIVATGCCSDRTVPERRLAVPPVLFSKTHSQNEWSDNQVAVMQWNIPKNAIKGYALIMNKVPVFEVQPLVNLEPEAMKFITPKLSDGVTYFHMRTIGADERPSATAHYKLNICAEKPVTPQIKSPTHTDGAASKRRSLKLIWEDGGICVKGFYYSLTPKENAEPDLFITNNGIEFHNLKDGTYTFSLRAASRTGIKGDISKYRIVIVP